MQGEAPPAQHLFELILGRPFRVVVHEDNEATITIVRKGYSPKLRAMQRTHKTNTEQLHELITESVQNYNEDGDPSGPVVLQHHEGITHKGDLFTKCLEPTKFQEGLKLLKVRQPQLPPPLKKGKVIDFNLNSPPHGAKPARGSYRTLPASPEASWVRAVRSLRVVRSAEGPRSGGVRAVDGGSAVLPAPVALIPRASGRK